jgi:hypothetical protein
MVHFSPGSRRVAFCVSTPRGEVMKIVLSGLFVLASIFSTSNSHAESSQAVVVHNADMEQITRDATTHAIIPVGWKAGGDLAFDFSAVGPSVMAAASGSYYARLATKNAANRAFWIISDFISTNGKKTANVNFSVRSTFTDVRISIHEFDAKWKEIGIVEGPVVNFTDSTWSKYSDKAGAYTLTLDPRATTIELVFGGLAKDGPNYLDIDAVSLELR